MVNLTVRYDKKLGSNVFVVRDDESYVSSTKTILTIVDEPYYPTIEGHVDHSVYRVGITVNVLRETGESNIVIYDGDEVLDVVPWQGVTLPLSYDFAVGTVHKLKAVFMGNKHCLKSHSKSYEVSMADLGGTYIEYTGNPVILFGYRFSFEIFTLVDEDVHVPVPDGKIIFSYTNGTDNGIKEATVSDGSATVTLDNDFLTMVGLFDISVRYISDTDYAPAVLTFQISKFYTLTFEGYNEYRTYDYSTVKDSKWIMGEPYILEGSIIDYMGNPYKDTEHQVRILGTNSETGYTEFLAEGSVDDDGKFQITLDTSDSQEVPYKWFSFIAWATPVNLVQFTPEAIVVQRVDITRAFNSYGDYRFYVDVIGDVYKTGGGVDTNISLSSVPVRVSYQGNDEKIFLTNAQGRATCNYDISESEVGNTLDIYCGNIHVTHDIEYALIDYVAPTWEGRDLSLRTTTKQPLQTGMKYTSKAAPSSNYSLIYMITPSEYERNSIRFSFTVVENSNTSFYYGLIDDTGGIRLFGFPDDNWLGAGDVAEYYYNASMGEITCTAKGRERFRQTMGALGASKYYPCIIYTSSDTDGYVVLNNIKYEVLK